jgi:hypothetical protein
VPVINFGFVARKNPFDAVLRFKGGGGCGDSAADRTSDSIRYVNTGKQRRRVRGLQPREAPTGVPPSTFCGRRWAHPARRSDARNRASAFARAPRRSTASPLTPRLHRHHYYRVLAPNARLRKGHLLMAGLANRRGLVWVVQRHTDVRSRAADTPSPAVLSTERRAQGDAAASHPAPAAPSARRTKHQALRARPPYQVLSVRPRSFRPPSSVLRIRYWAGDQAVASSSSVG